MLAVVARTTRKPQVPRRFHEDEEALALNQALAQYYYYYYYYYYYCYYYYYHYCYHYYSCYYYYYYYYYDLQRIIVIVIHSMFTSINVMNSVIKQLGGQLLLREPAEHRGARQSRDGHRVNSHRAYSTVALSFPLPVFYFLEFILK